LDTQTPRNILVAPLDWGLGHTTRCIPIIRYLLQKGHKITLAGNDWQRKYVENTVPDVATTHLDGYNITYGKGSLTTALLLQIPALLKKINIEHAWLAEQKGYDLIISDNRYGLYRKDIPSAIMTHQLSIQTGKGGVADSVLRKMHYRFLERFNETWIVDVAGKHNLAGKLSHPDALPKGGKYIGLLSQLAAPQNEVSAGKHLLILLSGPEPQRSILSAILWKQMKKYKNGKVVFVEGSDDVTTPVNVPTHITYYKKVSGNLLHSLITDASMVICRSGYSTIMDLVRQNKKAILIPTPGQTEQEYLGKHLHTQGMFYSTVQKGFDLEKVLIDTLHFPFKDSGLRERFDGYKGVVDGFIK